MTDTSRSAVHEHRTDRCGKRIVNGQPLESVVVNELRRSVSRELGFRTRIDHTGSEQRLFYIMPAHRSGMRMCAFLRDGRRLHQSAVDMFIDRGERISDALRI